MTRITQRDRVLKLAIERGLDGFTRRDAANELGCFELASRIGELEAEGCQFHRHPFAGKNRYGDLTNGTLYVLAYAPPVLHERANPQED